MKKYILIIFWILLININLFAGGRMIIIEYAHSLRIQHNRITIELGSENNSERIFYELFALFEMEEWL